MRSVHIFQSPSTSDECQFIVRYNPSTGLYALKTAPSPGHGLTYGRPKPGEAIITSKTGPTREFKFTRVTTNAETEEEAGASSLPPVVPTVYTSVCNFYY
jgi:hypothetical protein